MYNQELCLKRVWRSKPFQPDIFDSTCDPVPLGKSLENCLLYADDLLLMSLSGKSLQQCLNKFYDYTKNGNCMLI